MAPVPHLYQISTGANFLNGTGVGANFSNGTSAKHFQTLAPVSYFEWHRCWCQFFKWHQCQTLSNFGTGDMF